MCWIDCNEPYETRDAQPKMEYGSDMNNYETKLENRFPVVVAGRETRGAW